VTNIQEGRVREAWDRLVASDPGLVRARMAVSSVVSVCVLIAAEFGYAKALHRGYQPTLVAMILGASVALMSAPAMSGTTARPKIRTAMLFPVALGAGMTLGVATAGHVDLMLWFFVVVLSAGVWVRRFGLDYFTYGLMLWVGFFFTSFLGARASMLPSLLGYVLVATAFSLLLSLTVLRTHAGRTLRRMQRAFGARARAVALACAELLDSVEDPTSKQRAERHLHTRTLRLAEAALMIEAWSAEPGALPSGWSGAALRRRMLDAQLAIDALAHASVTLADQGGDLAMSASRVAGHLSRGEYPGAVLAARSLDATGAEGEAGAAAMQLVGAAMDFVSLVGDSATPPAVEERDDYAPAASLMLGVLPGSPAVAGGLPARGRWNPLRRASLPTRQAIQVAVAATLAIVLGRELSDARYYWAVITTFLTFTGTATRAESVLKVGNRVLGALLGLGLGIGLAELTTGHTWQVLGVILLAITLAFYLTNVSHAAMMFFFTVVVGQLYNVLHTFSPHLMVLRLEETTLGGVIGILVGLVVLPTSTRDTAKAARGAFLDAMADVLGAAAEHLAGRGGQAGDPGALTRTMEDRMRKLALVAQPLTRRLIPGVEPDRARHQLMLYAAAARHARVLAASPLRITDPKKAAAAAASLRLLAGAATALKASLGSAQPATTPESSGATRKHDRDLFAFVAALSALTSELQRSLYPTAELLAG
jgi:uncharacterized membrane protein YccC